MRGLYAEARSAFERSRRINPRHLPGSKDALASDRLAETAREELRLAAVEARLAPDLAPREATLSPEERRALAARLESAGETIAAKGERLRAALDQAALAPAGGRPTAR